VLHLMAEFNEQAFQLFLHPEPTVIGTDSDQFRRFRSAPRSAPHKLDLSFTDDVSRERRQPSIFSDTKYGARFEAAHVVFGDNGLRRFVACYGCLRPAFRSRIYEPSGNFRLA